MKATHTDAVRPAHARARAFTLIELLMVIAFIAILTSLLLPLSRWRQRTRAHHLQRSHPPIHHGLSHVCDGSSRNAPQRPLRQSRSHRLPHPCPLHESPRRPRPIQRQPKNARVPQPRRAIQFRRRLVLRRIRLCHRLQLSWRSRQHSVARLQWLQGFLSPQHTEQDSQLPLVTDINDWSPGLSKTFAPHAANGPVSHAYDFSNPSAVGASSKDIGAVGGNVGLLDGSVSWKNIKQMKPWRGSQLWDNGSCFALW